MVLIFKNYHRSNGARPADGEQADGGGQGERQGPVDGQHAPGAHRPDRARVAVLEAELAGQLAEGLPDLLIGGGAGYAEDIVEALAGHGSIVG